MVLDSDQFRLADDFDLGDARAGRLVILEHPRANFVRRR
jgi:hypothetical protein